MAKKKNLLDLLYEADAIEIDGVFCRWFHMEYELGGDSEEIVMDLEFESDGCEYEYFFTAAELESAEKHSGSDGWYVHYGMDTVTIVPYKITEVKA